MNLNEAFTRKKLEVGHLSILGCLVYFHIPSKKRMKLVPILEKGMFIGYNET